jgi:hypothetical protein
MREFIEMDDFPTFKITNAPQEKVKEVNESDRSIQD